MKVKLKWVEHPDPTAEREWYAAIGGEWELGVKQSGNRTFFAQVVSTTGLLYQAYETFGTKRQAQACLRKVLPELLSDCRALLEAVEGE